MNFLDVILSRLFTGCTPPATPTATTASAEGVTGAANTSETSSNRDTIQITPLVHPSFSQITETLQRNHDTRFQSTETWVNQIASANTVRENQNRPHRHLAFELPHYSFSFFVDINRSAIPWRLPPASWYLSEDASMALHISGENTQLDPAHMCPLFRAPFENYESQCPSQTNAGSIFFATYGVDSLIGNAYAAIENGRIRLYNTTFWNLLENQVAQRLDFFRSRDFHFTEQGLAYFLSSQIPRQRNRGELSPLAAQVSRNDIQNPVVLDALLDEALNEPTHLPIQSRINLPQETAPDYNGYFGNFRYLFHEYATQNGASFDLLNFFHRFETNIRTQIGNVFIEDYLMVADSNNPSLVNLHIESDSHNPFTSLTLTGSSQLNWLLMQISPNLRLGAGHINITADNNYGHLHLNANSFHFAVDPTLQSRDAFLQNGFISTQNLQAENLQIHRNQTLSIPPGLHLTRVEQRYPANDTSPHAVLELTGNVSISAENHNIRISTQVVFRTRFRWDEQGLHLIPGENKIELRHFNFGTRSRVPQFLQFSNSDISLSDMPHVVQMQQSVCRHDQTETDVHLEIRDGNRNLSSLVPVRLSNGFYNLETSLNPLRIQTTANLHPGSFGLNFNTSFDSNQCRRNFNFDWNTSNVRFSPNFNLVSGNARLNLGIQSLQNGLYHYNLDSSLQGLWQGQGFSLIDQLASALNVVMPMGHGLRRQKFEGRVSLQGRGNFSPSNNRVNGNVCLNAEGNLNMVRARQNAIPVISDESNICLNMRGRRATANVNLLFTPAGINAMSRASSDFTPYVPTTRATEAWEVRVSRFPLGTWNAPENTGGSR